MMSYLTYSKLLKDIKDIFPDAYEYAGYIRLSKESINEILYNIVIDTVCDDHGDISFIKIFGLGAFKYDHFIDYLNALNGVQYWDL